MHFNARASRAAFTDELEECVEEEEEMGNKDDEELDEEEDCENGIEEEGDKMEEDEEMGNKDDEELDEEEYCENENLFSSRRPAFCMCDDMWCVSSASLPPTYSQYSQW